MWIVSRERPLRPPVILRPFRYGRVEAENDVLVELHADVTASRRRSITAISSSVSGSTDGGLADDIDNARAEAVKGLRAYGYSWVETGSRLGITRQAAQQRWG